RQVPRADIADEGESVRERKAALSDGVSLEAGRLRARQERDLPTRLHGCCREGRWGAASEERDLARARLADGAEGIRAGVGDGDPGIEAVGVGDEGEEQVR